jgi:hypothetical protein
MFEHRCGSLTCPECMTVQTFVAIVIDGRHYNHRGDRVAHITDASCRRCGYTYGRQDVRDEDTGAVSHRQPIIPHALALAAARALGLPPAAALYEHAEATLAAEVAAASLRSPPATPAAAPCSLRSPAAAAGAPQDSLRSPVAPPADFDSDDSLSAFLEQHRRPVAR